MDAVEESSLLAYSERNLFYERKNMKNAKRNPFRNLTNGKARDYLIVKCDNKSSSKHYRVSYLLSKTSFCFWLEIPYWRYNH